METLLKRLLDRLELIANQSPEIHDTDCREKMADSIYKGFVWQERGFDVPDEFALFTPEGNDAVRKALVEYIEEAVTVAAESGLATPEQRLNAFQNSRVASEECRLYFDDFFGFTSIP